MALEDFWNNVRAGVQFLLPRNITDSPLFDYADVERQLRGLAFALTPAVVRDFDEADFPFLSEADRSDLKQSVEELRTVAAKVPQRGPAAPQDEDAARPPFLRILKLLEFDRFADAEAYRVGKTIEAQAEFPRSAVKDARYRTVIDSQGYPAIRIMLYLPDATMDAFLKQTLPIRDVIWDLVSTHGKPYWPRTSFRMESDLQELQAVGGEQ